MEPFVGQIQAFGFNFAPSGWAVCEGQTMPIQANVALFSLLGTTYGGDGQTTFGLPDLRAASTRDAVHYCIAVNGAFPPRD
jgi:microcystin-dependent protein